MKTAAIVLMILALVLGGVMVYGLFNTSLQVAGKGLEVYPATERAGEFEMIRQAVENNSLIGTVVREEEMGGPSEYNYFVYTLRLNNPGLVPAEMVEMQITPQNGDVLFFDQRFYGSMDEIVIPPKSSQDIWCVMLTRGPSHAVRELKVTYYLWGHPQEVKYIYDDSY